MAGPTPRDQPERPGGRLGLRASSPFARTAPAVVSAWVFAAATLVWLVAGDRLPGGRWLAVHLFTLGVLTNLIWVFSQHFATRFTAAPRPPHEVRRSLQATLALDVGIVALLAGHVAGLRWALAGGTLVIVGVVGWSYLVLRGLRAHTAQTRFGWVVRAYGHAHLAFLAGAVLGGLLGIGVLSGRWYGAARDAHLHANLLGWAGLTLLATLVVFGPALLRARMAEGADERAGRALPWGAGGLAVAVAALMATGAGGTAATVTRWLAIGGLVVYLWATWVVVAPLLRVAWHAGRSPLRWTVMGACLWLPVALVIDLAVVATDARAWFDLVGLLLLVGVLAQIVLTVMVHLAPLLRGQDAVARGRIHGAAERFALGRALLLNLGVLVVAVAYALPRLTTVETGATAVAGWVAIALGVAAHLAVVVWPAGGSVGGPQADEPEEQQRGAEPHEPPLPSRARQPRGARDEPQHDHELERHADVGGRHHESVQASASLA